MVAGLGSSWIREGLGGSKTEVLETLRRRFRSGTGIWKTILLGLAIDLAKRVKPSYSIRVNNAGLHSENSW